MGVRLERKFFVWMIRFTERPWKYDSISRLAVAPSNVILETGNLGNFVGVIPSYIISERRRWASRCKKRKRNQADKWRDTRRMT